MLYAKNYLLDHRVAFQFSCMMAPCGSCGMMINGIPRLGLLKGHLMGYSKNEKKIARLAGDTQRQQINEMKNTIIERREIELSYRINFEEPIPDLIERLKREHRQFESKLAELEAADTFNKQSMKILEELGDPIVRHAVEEEARVMRVIMHKAKEQSGESIKIAQEHNWIADFIKKTIPALASMPKQQAKQEVVKFVQNLRSHFVEEEQVMFPLALKANSLQK